ncbi:hypothetical protein QE152_g9739 [Popillia japonica]|uniref:FZ domain-containing protein n=1 Tax=Popillia japonica TaxID=7064 RepID=A0AAW1LX74_POPJA
MNALEHTPSEFSKGTKDNCEIQDTVEMEAYRRWVCSSLVPNFVGPDLRVRPCLNVCQNVEQQCPYMLPGDRAPAHPTQYAGEPTFLCLGRCQKYNLI